MPIHLEPASRKESEKQKDSPGGGSFYFRPGIINREIDVYINLLQLYFNPWRVKPIDTFRDAYSRRRNLELRQILRVPS
jgi:hypothetical protein